METIIDVFKEHVKKTPNKNAILSGQFYITYKKLDELSGKLAKGLYNSNFRQGDLIAVILPDIPEYFAVIIGGLKIGCRILPISIHENTEDILYKLESTKASCLVYHTSFSNRINEILNNKHERYRKIVVGGAAGDNISYDTIIRDFTPFREEKLPAKNTDAMIVFSSGRNKLPESSILTHENLYFCAQNINNIFNINSDDKIAVLAKKGHHFSTSAGFGSPILAGATICMTDRFFGETKNTTVIENDITVLAATPGYIENIDLSDDKFDRNIIRLGIIYSESRISKETFRLYKQIVQSKMYRVYGSLNTTTVLAYTLLNDEGDLNSLGSFCYDVDVRIIDEHGQEVLMEETGHLSIKKQPGITCYNGTHTTAADKTTETESGTGIFKTDMLCYIDTEKKIRFLGKTDDLINRGGFIVNSYEVENKINENNAVIESAVIALSDDEYINKIKTFIVLPEGKTLKTEELLESLTPILPKYKRPQQIVLIDNLPKNEDGEVLKRMLK